MAKKKSSLMAYFINTGTVEAPVWAPLGKGVTKLEISYNPQVTQEAYIDEDNASAAVDSYQPSIALDITLWDATSAPAHAFIEGKRTAMAVAAAAETDVLEVDISGVSPYPATKHSAVIAIDKFSLEGGKPQMISPTIYYNGDPEVGTAVVTAGVPVFTKTA